MSGAPCSTTSGCGNTASNGESSAGDTELEVVGDLGINHDHLFNANISGSFKRYLKQLAEKDPLDMIASKKPFHRKPRVKPHVSAITTEDTDMIWNEVIRFAKKGKHQDWKVWMTVNFYLSGLVVKSKLKSIDNYLESHAGTMKAACRDILQDTRKLFYFHCLFSEEMFQKYLEFSAGKQ